MNLTKTRLYNTFSKLKRETNMKNLKLKKRIVFFFLSLWLLLLPEISWASDVATIDTALQSILDILTGTAAKTIATIAIAAIGYLWMSGKLSIKQAVTIGLGIGIIFGAPEIASLLGA